MLLLFLSYKYELLSGNHKPLSSKTGSLHGIRFRTGVGIVLFSAGPHSQVCRVEPVGWELSLNHIPALSDLFNTQLPLPVVHIK